MSEENMNKKRKTRPCAEKSKRILSNITRSTMCITNEVISKRILRTDSLPEGWRYGFIGKGPKIDVTGQKFNSLTAVSWFSTKSGVVWRFQCDCGNPELVGSCIADIKRGLVKSCGCFSRFKKGSIPWNKDIKFGPNGRKGISVNTRPPESIEKQKKTLQEKKERGILLTSQCKPETKEKIRKTLSGRTYPERWNAITRDGRKYKQWERTVKKRDNYTCRKCGKENLKKKDCHAHHIKDWDLFVELRFDVENGLTLCMSCHMKEPKKNQEN